MAGETATALWAAAGIVAASAIALVSEMRKGRGENQELLGFLRSTTQSSVDETSAMLIGYTIDVQNWNARTPVNLTVSNICSDIRAVARVGNRMTLEQWEELHRRLHELIATMRGNNLDPREIEIMRDSLR